ncbi:TPA: CYTH domain-containing protein [Candidatus Saccharibacteria bacterium]|nr:CYTH domain-containing protein [Candidatus Saccharibacteria bacterium]HIO87308.1 CYTH domain-containing protein [Candidatus Saccharibacteria bacterium]
MAMKNIEYEARILEIEPVPLINKLKALGAERVGDHFFRRHVFETLPPIAGRWVRLRTNGKTSTLTVKQITSDKVDGTKEWETVVEDFESTLMVLEKIGLKSKGYQENKRLEYRMGDVSICIDQWPKIPAYLEIEAPNKKSINETAKLIGYSDGDLCYLNPEKIYLKYGIDISKKANISF